ncbi:MAG: glycosyltransferase family 39 protein [Chromatiales bacterium]|jgi:4-amino-4-deoxy-L-arabinose transferase-like glycosyltransferase
MLERKVFLYWAFVLLPLLLVGHAIFFVGFIASDDALYVNQVNQYLSGDLSPPETHWGFRYTVVVPLLIVAKIFGLSEFSLSVFSLIYIIILLVLFGAFVSREIGNKPAMYAGLLLVSMPLVVVQSSILNIDFPEALFLFASMISFYYANEAREKSLSLFFLAGVLLGLAMLSRETAYGFLLILALYFLFGGYRHWKYYLAGLLGVFSIVCLEWLYYLLSGESVLYRYFTIAHSHGTVGIKSGDFTAGSGNISDSRLFAPWLALLVNQEFALLFWVGAAAVFYLLKQKLWGNYCFLNYLAVFFVVYFLWISYSGAIRPLPRYYTFLAILMTIPIGIVLSHLKSHLLKVLLILLILGTSFGAMSVENLYPRFAARTIAEYAMRVDELVVTDPDSSRKAKGHVQFFKGNTHLVSDEIPQNQAFLYARVKGVSVDPGLRPYLNIENRKTSFDPPKLLVGKILDLSGLATLLPHGLYQYLAIRNPGVIVYRIPALD